MADFMNNDEALLARVQDIRDKRAAAGLDGLSGGLETVVINVETEDLEAAATELARYSGLEFAGAFEDDHRNHCLLTLDGCADFLITSRKNGENPFLPYNKGPKSAHKPNARLESFWFKCPDVRSYRDIQLGRGVEFAGDVQETDAYLFVETKPSRYTGNSLGFIQWKDQEGSYAHSGTQKLPISIAKPDLPHLRNIFELDHTATRVHAQERDAAICEFMELTSYDFKFAVYVDSLNSITNVARLSKDDYAQVFTSGIKPFDSLESSGPTEAFIHNYGLRLHHLAFRAEDIETTFQALKDDGMDFLVELVGGLDEGLHQTFSQSSRYTFLVNEYIQRYGDFEGFFTKSNVTALTKATEKQ